MQKDVTIAKNQLIEDLGTGKSYVNLFRREEQTENGIQVIAGEQYLLSNPVTFESILAAVEQTPERVIEIKTEEARFLQKIAAEKLQLKTVIEQVQTLDDTDALENQAVYPFWSDFIGKQVVAGHKYQDFNSEGEMCLWRVNDGKSHVAQADWRPKDTPSEFTRVGYDGEILDFVQPTGVHDSYMKGDKVRFDGHVWESLIDNNVYSPNDYPQGWKQL